VILEVSSGWDDPRPDEIGAYDAIHVGAAASHMPEGLLKRLKVLCIYLLSCLLVC
jgi:protein-L-isoaspartate O-methyltransferase